MGYIDFRSRAKRVFGAFDVVVIQVKRQKSSYLQNFLAHRGTLESLYLSLE